MSIHIATIMILTVAALLAGCGSDRSIPPQGSPLEITLKQVIEKGWDNSILEISEVFPDGELTRGNPKKRTASRYVLQAFLGDIGHQGELSFQQPEWLLPDKAPYPTRRFVIDNVPKDALNFEYEKIREFIKHSYPGMLTRTNPREYDYEYCISMFDDVGNILIGLQAEMMSPSSIRIDVTHSVVRRRSVMPSGSATAGK